MMRMSLPTPTLRTVRLRLRPFDDADGNGLVALHTNADVLRYGDAPPWSKCVRAEQFSFGLPADGRGRHRSAAGRGPCRRRGLGSRADQAGVAAAVRADLRPLSPSLPRETPATDLRCLRTTSVMAADGGASSPAAEHAPP
jgi:hypothetical protein